MATTGDLNSLATQIQGLLSLSPPFLTSKSIDVLSDLLRPEFLLGTPETGTAWDALDRLPPPSVQSALTHPQISTAFPIFVAITTDGTDVIDDQSFCLSCPLNPTHPDQVYQTSHKIVLEPIVTAGTPAQETKKNWWKDLPWSSGKKLEKPLPKVLARKIFYVPQNAVSILVTWWGYRLFLPHSILLKMAVELNPTTTALTTISTVLTFIVKHIPAPVQLLPGVAQITAILPIISTICAAISWEWSDIKAKDKGFGDCMVACWLLPVALWAETLDPVKWPPPIVGTPGGTLEVRKGTLRKAN